MGLVLYNTLTKKKGSFSPLIDNEVGMYSCGPTVYDYPHIGNLRAYVFADVLKRALLLEGYQVKHVMNITDVGHLTSDADEGEDKLEAGAKRQGKTVWEIAEFYTEIFKKHLQALNILPPDVWAKATLHIEEQIALAKVLQEKGFAYETKQALYFDVSKFADYTRLSGQKLEEKLTGARQEVVSDNDKRNPQDFALWFKRTGRFADHIMHWPSPFGEGFPGWHIECSAMSMKYLGEQFDIHTGGVDHIATHHTNEIAQSEAATGKKPFVRFWMHGEFLLVNGGKMAKSKGTFITLDDIARKGFSPMAFRLLVLQTHYRSKLNFTWQSLEAAQNVYTSVENSVENLRMHCEPEDVFKESLSSPYVGKFLTALEDDLNTPVALSVCFDVLKESAQGKIGKDAALGILLYMDKVLGLGLDTIGAPEILTINGQEVINRSGSPLSQDIIEQLKIRIQAREEQNWELADAIRNDLRRKGYETDDTSGSNTIMRKRKTYG